VEGWVGEWQGAVLEVLVAKKLGEITEGIIKTHDPSAVITECFD